MDREKRRAGDTGGAAGDIADRQELRTGEVPRAAAGRADESKLDGARATDSAGGGEAAERAGAARDDGDGHDANPDWPDAEPAQELGVAADRSDRAAAPGAGGTDPRRDPAAGGGAAAAAVARGQPVGAGDGGNTPESGKPGYGAAGQTLEECRSAGPGVPAGSSARSTGECADGGSRAAAGSAPDPAGTTAAASSPDPAGSGAANPADAAAESCGGRPAAPGSRPGIDEVVALPSGGGAWFRKTVRKLKGQKRADRDEQILSLLAQGYRNKAIARELGIDVKTVRRVRKGAK